MQQPISLTPIVDAIRQVSDNLRSFDAITDEQRFEKVRLGQALQAIEDLVTALCLAPEGYKSFDPPPFMAPED